jgi:DedD protein
MEVRIRERLVGALVLVGFIVLLVPAILKGRGTASQKPDSEIKSVEIMLGGAQGSVDDEGLVPEPEIIPAKPQASVSTATPLIEPAPASAATGAPESPAPLPASETAKPAAAEQFAWAVQLGAFSSRAKADELVANLRSHGYAAFVLEYRGGGQLLHRVRVGPEQDRVHAVAIAERLNKDGFQPVIAPHP